MPSKNPTMATDRVMMVLCLMIQSVPISSTMAVTRVSSRQNYTGRETMKDAFHLQHYHILLWRDRRGSLPEFQVPKG